MSNNPLSYAVNANQDPIQASPSEGAASLLTLVIVVSNNTGQSVECQSIEFSFLQGTNARDLFSDSTGISTSAPTGWNLTQQGSSFTAKPASQEDGEIGADGVVFTISSITVNDQPGTTKMIIVQTTSNGTTTIEYPLQKFPQQFEVGPLTADPLFVKQGGSTTLFWSGTGGATYTLQYPDDEGGTVTVPETGDPPLPPTGSYRVDNLQVTPVMTFNLVVTVKVEGQDEPLTVERQCIVTVSAPQPAINSFSITPNPITPGQLLSFTLSWNVIGSFQITANDGEGGNERVLPIPNSATSYTVFPTQLETIYTLTAFGQSPKETRTEMKEDNSPRHEKDAPTSQVTAVINQMVPVGTVISYAGNSNSLPPGWLTCDGSAFNQDQYPDLYAALGNSNTLPNLAGYFLRGLDKSGKIDPDGPNRAILSVQADTFGQHSHNTTQTPWFWNEDIGGDGYIVGTKTTNGLHTQPSSTEGGAETRPKNAAVLYLIFAGLPQQ
ncbi:MAG TPA: phage tail protein [Pyrinomonadaceae bacterium]|nr:phage tail protein [Pyrinomonadaceae bacterium]